MKERVGSLLVYDNHQCVGIVTERDFLRSTAMAIPMETPISRVMTSYENFHFAHTTDSISALMQTMTKRGVRHIPVQNTAGDIVGIVSIRDVVARLVDDHMEEVRRYYFSVFCLFALASLLMTFSTFLNTISYALSLSFV